MHGDVLQCEDTPAVPTKCVSEDAGIETDVAARCVLTTHLIASVHPAHPSSSDMLSDNHF